MSLISYLDKHPALKKSLITAMMYTSLSPIGQVFAKAKDRLKPLKLTGATEQVSSVNLTGDGHMIGDYNTILGDITIENMGTFEGNGAYLKVVPYESIKGAKQIVENTYEKLNPKLTSGTVIDDILDEMDNLKREQIPLLQKIIHSNPDSLVDRLQFSPKEVYQSMINNNQEEVTVPVVYGSGEEGVLGLLRFDVSSYTNWLEQQMKSPDISSEELEALRKDYLDIERKLDSIEDDVIGFEDRLLDAYDRGFKDGKGSRKEPEAEEKKGKGLLPILGGFAAAGLLVYLLSNKKGQTPSTPASGASVTGGQGVGNTGGR